MPTSNTLEARARARRRRELIRKKRIRRCLSITVLTLLLVLIIMCIVSLINAISSKDDTTQTAQQQPTTSQQTLPKTDAISQGPTTITASIGGSTTGAYTINETATSEEIAEILGIPSPGEENDLIQIIADANQKKHCYLTFEDGPSDITIKILDVLRKFNIKATFFMTSDTIKKYPDIARRVHEEGHLIANRVVLSNYDKVYADTDSFMTALSETEDAIKDIINSNDRLFNLVRLPGGTPEYTNSNQYKDMKLKCIDLLEDEGYYYCDWNTTNGDDANSKTAKQLYTTFVDSSNGYNNLIVAMHDSSSKKTTAEALDDIINHLSDKEYTFHRLDDINYNPEADAQEVDEQSNEE